MCKGLWTVSGVLGVLLFMMTVSVTAEQTGTVFEMEKVPLFEQAAGSQPELTGLSRSGQYAYGSFQRHEEVKKYPRLNSSRPIYGSVTFDQDLTDPGSGVRFLFVIDESSSDKTQTADGRSSLRGLADTLAGTRATSGTKTQYDRLYFDANRDLDLTNDPVVKPMEDLPTGVSSSPQYVVFDYLNVPFDYGPELGTRPFKVLPRLTLYRLSPYVTFTAAVAYRGKIKLADQEFTALLTQSRKITGRFDRPYTQLYLIPTDSSRKPVRSWSGQYYLSTLRPVDGELYQISATPTGDRLTVGPYRGDYGLLKVGPGERQNIQKLGVSGVLYSKQMMLPLGDIASMPPAENLPEHKIPVGDYTPTSLTVDFGNLTARLSQNYYSKDAPHARLPKPTAESLKIRKDDPLVLDFSRKPMVLFTYPTKGQTVKPGTSVKIRAVIVDSQLGMLVRSLYDRTQKTGERTTRYSDGRTVTTPSYASLAPTVVVTDSSGKQVAEGTMPFG